MSTGCSRDRTRTLTSMSFQRDARRSRACWRFVIGCVSTHRIATSTPERNSNSLRRIGCMSSYADAKTVVVEQIMARARNGV